MFDIVGRFVSSPFANPKGLFPQVPYVVVEPPSGVYDIRRDSQNIPMLPFHTIPTRRSSASRSPYGSITLIGLSKAYA